jgi:hypothetical protein
VLWKPNGFPRTTLPIDAVRSFDLTKQPRLEPLLHYLPYDDYFVINQTTGVSIVSAGAPLVYQHLFLVNKSRFATTGDKFQYEKDFLTVLQRLIAIQAKNRSSSGSLKHLALVVAVSGADDAFLFEPVDKVRRARIPNAELSL